jgi:hypothetical protein
MWSNFDEHSASTIERKNNEIFENLVPAKGTQGKVFIVNFKLANCRDFRHFRLPERVYILLLI